jgi:2-alkenal reductase
LIFPLQMGGDTQGEAVQQSEVAVTPVIEPTFTIPPRTPGAGPELGSMESGDLAALYAEVNPGVVSIQVFVQREGATGEGAGSGFVLDDDGHIVTNNHVVAGAQRITVVFYDGSEEGATIVGTDDDSDLAVIQVDTLPADVHPLVIGDSDQVEVGEWVVAIGNPFSLGGSMTLGIVSAIGRSIPSGVARFVIPEAIQTDAAINPGNSGGPLLDLQGRVIGVNAQIASGGAQASAGVGFAIPSNVVRRVAPVLIESGAYVWPWLGVEGTSLNLLLQQANDIEGQRGAYISLVISGGPAEAAGLQGSSGTVQVDEFTVPVGGDVVIEAGGETVNDFDDLLAIVASRNPGDALELVILRDGERQEVTVTLEPRPANPSP